MFWTLCFSPNHPFFLPSPLHAILFSQLSKSIETKEEMEHFYQNDTAPFGLSFSFGASLSFGIEVKICIPGKLRGKMRRDE